MDLIDWQLSSMTLLFLTGIFWGLLHDFFKYIKKRRIRARARVKGRIKKGTNLMDFAFWVVSFIVIVPLIFYANWMDLRLYVWFSIGSGLLTYIFLFQRPLTTLLGFFFER